MRVHLYQSQCQPCIFKQLNCRTMAHARIITQAQNGLLIVHTPSELCFDEQRVLYRGAIPSVIGCILRAAD